VHLTAIYNSPDGGLLFILEGDRFTMTSGAAQKDPALWMHLVDLRYRLDETFRVVPLLRRPTTNVGFGPVDAAGRCPVARRHYRQRREHRNRPGQPPPVQQTPRPALPLMTPERPCGRCLLLPPAGEAYRQIGTAVWTFAWHRLDLGSDCVRLGSSAAGAWSHVGHESPPTRSALSACRTAVSP